MNILPPVIRSLRETLMNPNASELCGEIAEIAIDATIKDDLLKTIPIVKTVVAGGNIIAGIRDRSFLKQTASFINGVNSRVISKADLKTYQKHLEDSYVAQEELERVVVLLDSFIDKEKSTLLGRFYSAYVLQRIDWSQFVELSEALARISVSDFETLYDICSNQPIKESDLESYRVERLSASGLTSKIAGSITIYPGSVNPPAITVSLSSLGEIFCAEAQAYNR